MLCRFKTSFRIFHTTFLRNYSSSSTSYVGLGQHARQTVTDEATVGLHTKHSIRIDEGTLQLTRQPHTVFGQQRAEGMVSVVVRPLFATAVVVQKRRRD